MDYINKAVDLLGAIFDLVIKVLKAVNGDDANDETVQQMNDTKDMVNEIAGAVQTFAGEVEKATK